jgi:hypothetical protein
VSPSRDRQAGYALLAALLIMALAGAFALVVVGAVHAVQLVAAADADAARARRLEGAALRAAAGRLRWAPAEASGAVSGGDPGAREQWQAQWQPAPPVGGAGWPRRRVAVSAAAALARRAAAATVELRAEEWAVGVSCLHDAQVDAPLTILGSGLYVGGCLRGREQVTFAPGAAGVTPGGRPADGARGADCPVASAHAGAGIFAAGVEIHDGLGGAYVEDGDPHTGAPVPAAWVAGPSPELLCAAAVQGAPLGGALVDRTLRLGAVPAADPAQALVGRCLAVPRGDEVTIEGVASEDAGRLLVIVPGDAVVGQPGERVVLRGGLVVCGRLTVRSDLLVEGSLHAGSLQIEASTTVVLPIDWRSRPLPGAARPVVVETGP